MALRWGICSTGKICNDFCSALKTLSHDDHKLVAVVSRTLENAKTFASKFDITKTYSSYEEFAKDPEIEIVYIGSTYNEHVRLSIMMLKAGKHVLCEKPLADSVAEVQMVHKVAKETNLFFMEAVWSRCSPIYVKIREELASGSIGDVQMVSSNLYITKEIDYLKAVQTTQNGGMLLEAGIYTVQLACLAYGEEPVSIKASGDVIETGHDIDGCIILTYSKGQKACCMYSVKALISSMVEGRAAIHGTKGVIELPSFFWSPSEANLSTGHVTNDIPVGPVPYIFPNSGGLSYEADVVRKCIRNGETECPYYTHKDSEMVHRIMEETAKQIGRKLPSKT